MATAAQAPCPPELGGLSGRNASLVSGAQPCNRSAGRAPTYTPSATAAFAMAITFMMMATIVGNVLVIMAVLTSRSLRGAQNLFLVSLAAADILVATLIIPFSLANELQGYWAFSSVWCEIYLALDVLFCTSSIAHLCAIALDRYLSISRPVAYGAKRTASRIKAAIVVVWLISAVISFPPLLTLDKSNGGQEVCELNNERWYILYSTIGSFFAPCVIMILVYVRIYQIAKRRARCPPGRKRGAAGGGRSAERPPQNGRRPPKAAQERLSEAVGAALPSAASSTKTRKPREPANVAHLRPKPIHSDKGGEGAEEKPQEPEPEPEQETGQTGDREAAQRDASPSADGKGPAQNRRRGYKNTVASLSGTRLAPQGPPGLRGTPLSRRKAAASRERRFTFVLAVVMGVFVICWFPFFLSYSLQAVCPASCRIPDPLFKFFFWIGYCNSCLNPVIYTVFNKDFRKAFKRILCRSTKATFF